MKDTSSVTLTLQPWSCDASHSRTTIWPGYSKSGPRYWKNVCRRSGSPWRLYASWVLSFSCSGTPSTKVGCSTSADTYHFNTSVGSTRCVAHTGHNGNVTVHLNFTLMSWSLMPTVLVQQLTSPTVILWPSTLRTTHGRKGKARLYKSAPGPIWEHSVTQVPLLSKFARMASSAAAAAAEASAASTSTFASTWGGALTSSWHSPCKS